MAVLAGRWPWADGRTKSPLGGYAPEKIPYAIKRYVNETNRLYGVMGRRLTDHPYLAGEDYSIADMAAYPWVVPWQRQQQNLENFVNLRHWFNDIYERTATQRAYARDELFSAQPAITEEEKKCCLARRRPAVPRPGRTAIVVEALTCRQLRDH